MINGEEGYPFSKEEKGDARLGSARCSTYEIIRF